jgi:radical SAM superfamily enzyme YgiQ (UPF0313 family)
MFVGVESFSREALRAAHKFQNYPDTYDRIVELCRKHRITSHFSNIIGFPSDDEKAVLEHLRQLRALDPDVATFYLLTPIPGTDQYEEFLSEGLITTDNLDRLDGTCVTWRHPRLSPETWKALLLRCYREFYTGRDNLRRILRAIRGRWDYRTVGSLMTVAGYAALARRSVKKGEHPMSGGSGRVRLDRVSDYAALRRDWYGVDLVALPHGLALSPSDEAINRQAKLTGVS